ncbi:TolC family protein [uncultured Prevotella sp.]|uniref:TolC family protein n=1 Tax=uncultured Prevotella sp. TaxID=159272 RepID=UPI0026260D15|nr:TolC family protein [uncultured Prevotella sp.]
MQKRLLFCACIGMLCAADAAAQTQRSMTIGELFGLVETGSKTLRMQKTGVDVAIRGIEEARSRRLPDINASLAASYNGNVLMTDRDFGNARGLSQPHFGNSFALEAQQVIYAGGAISSGIRLAELQRAQSENAVEMTRNQMRLIALGQYLELLKLENGIKVYDSNIALTEKLIADIKSRQAQGMALKNDVTRYELQMESLKLGKRRLEDQKSIMNHQLCNTIGLENTIVVPSMTLDNIEDDNLMEKNLQAEAAGNSPQIRQAALGVKMAEQQLKLAKSEMLPKVAIVAADNFTGPFNYDIPPIDKNFNIWYVGVGVKYSISSLFKSNKSVRKAKEQLRQSHDTHAMAGEAVDNSMQQAYTMHRQAFAELHTQQKSVELAQQNYNVVNNRYLNQLALITDMIDASNIKLNAELQEINARINIAYTYYNIRYVAGSI